MSNTARLQSITQRYKQQLLHREAQALQSLEDAYTHTLAGVQQRLAVLYREMDAKQQAGESIPISWLYEAHRLQQAKQFIYQQFQHYGLITQAVVAQLQRTAVSLGSQTAREQLQFVFGDTHTLNMPSPAVLENLIGATQAGSPLADLFKGFGDEAAKGASDALIRGVAVGSSVQKIGRDVQQALDVSRARALTIARTEAMRSYKSANLETYRATGLIQQYRRIATKSAKTCAACIALDGTLYDLDEEFAQHPCCRCTMIPVRAGSSSDYQTGIEWFHEQPADVQRQILGDAKFQAFQDNQFSLPDVVGHSHDADWGPSIREKSLKELMKA